jgi:predicted O-linked N-acetylglucosamine transferase (SPINDLY family)
MSRKSPHRTGQAAEHPLIAQAVGLHQAGQLAEAARMYERILAQQPRHFDAMHLLGVVELQEGRFEQAQRLISAALKIMPQHGAALGNLGTVYLRSGQLEAARSHFERALKVEPDSPDALKNLGTVLRQLGRSREALDHLRRAYSAQPGSAAVCNLCGACLLDLGEIEESVTFFETATKVAPEDADGWSNLAVALNTEGDRDRALECAERAVALRPDSSSAVAALATVQFEQGRIETAVATYRKAAALPEPSAKTLGAFANALLTCGLCTEAIDQLRRAIAIDPDNAVARWKLSMAHCQPIYDGIPEIEASRAAFSRSLDDLQSWYETGKHPQAYAAVGSNQPFFLAYQPFNNRELLSRYGQLCVEWMTTLPPQPEPASAREAGAPRSDAAERKLRIGIASAHVRNHSVWNAITKGWIDHLDPARFEIHLFQLGPSSDVETGRARRKVAHFEDRPANLPAWVRVIGEAHLDVLIYPEIGMDPLTAQLAALRLAPVQAVAWGHPETSGLPTMDLYISAEGYEPLQAQENYSERLICLPNLGVFVEPLTPAVAKPDLKALGLPKNEPLLLCPGTPFKYSPVHDQVWARIARGLEVNGEGRLVFFRSHRESMNEMLEHRLRRVFAQERVDFDARVCLIPNLDRPRFFGLLEKSALMLDTLGFSGFNTALQAIECGLPMLAREGEFMRGRLASGIMRRMGLPELVAQTDESFIATAVELAADGSRRKRLQREIVDRRKVLFHDLEPVHALERCLVEAVARAKG